MKKPHKTARKLSEDEKLFHLMVIEHLEKSAGKATSANVGRLSGKSWSGGKVFLETGGVSNATRDQISKELFGVTWVDAVSAKKSEIKSKPETISDGLYDNDLRGLIGAVFQKVETTGRLLLDRIDKMEKNLTVNRGAITHDWRIRRGDPKEKKTEILKMRRAHSN